MSTDSVAQHSLTSNKRMEEGKALYGLTKIVGLLPVFPSSVKSHARASYFMPDAEPCTSFEFMSSVSMNPLVPFDS